MSATKAEEIREEHGGMGCSVKRKEDARFIRGEKQGCIRRIAPVAHPAHGNAFETRLQKRIDVASGALAGGDWGWAVAKGRYQ